MSGAKSRLLEFFQNNVGKYFPLSELAKVAQVSDWPRVIRAMRLNDGYDIEHIAKGPHKGCYVMRSLKMNPAKPRGGIDQRIRYRILQRDASCCQRCGRGVKEKVKLMVDHKIPVEWGGETVDDNLWTLCAECNLGKKNWLSDENSEEMKEVMSQSSGIKRLERFFELHPHELLEPTRLGIISGIRDWERTLRHIIARPI